MLLATLDQGYTVLGKDEDVLTIFSPFCGEYDHAKEHKSSVALDPPAIS